MATNWLLRPWRLVAHDSRSGTLVTEEVLFNDSAMAMAMSPASRATRLESQVRMVVLVLVVKDGP